MTEANKWEFNINEKNHKNILNDNNISLLGRQTSCKVCLFVCLVFFKYIKYRILLKN